MAKRQKAGATKPPSRKQGVHPSAVSRTSSALRHSLITRGLTAGRAANVTVLLPAAVGSCNPFPVGTVLAVI